MEVTTETTSINVHLTTAQAETIIISQGWEIHPIERGGRYFVRPDGKPRSEGGTFGNDYLWELDEAVTWAVTGEYAPQT